MRRQAANYFVPKRIHFSPGEMEEGGGKGGGMTCKLGREWISRGIREGADN